MVHDYELVYILDPDLAEEALTGLMDRVSTLATGQQAEIKHQERWEKRRLAYEINDKREGTYVVMELRAPAEAVSEMDRVLKITEGILRHLIVRADDAVKAKANGAAAAATETAAEAAPAAQPEVTAEQVDAPDAAPEIGDAVSAETAEEDVAAPDAAAADTAADVDTDTDAGGGEEENAGAAS
jgi:small subunit ribosomal protein S6